MMPGASLLDILARRLQAMTSGPAMEQEIGPAANGGAVVATKVSSGNAGVQIIPEPARCKPARKHVAHLPA